MADKKEAKKKDAPDEEGGGGKKKLIIMAAAGLILLLVIGGAVWFFVLKPEPVAEEEVDPGLDVPVPEITQSSTVGPQVDIKEFITNIISEDNNHYVKASITLELDKEEALEEINKRMPQVQDAILSLVSNKTYEELQDLQGRNQLKAELTSKLNSFLQAGRVKAIYFTAFVVQ